MTMELMEGECRKQRREKGENTEEGRERREKGENKEGTKKFLNLKVNHQAYSHHIQWLNSLLDGSL